MRGLIWRLTLNLNLYDKKAYILDTNVLLHDSSSLFNFGENDVVLSGVVLEEVDNFKRGSGGIHYQARRFIRVLEELLERVEDDFVSLNDYGGRLILDVFSDVSEKVSSLYISDKVDNILLSVAERFLSYDCYSRVVLVSKDMNLRVKSKVIGIDAEDYKYDKVVEKSSYSGVRVIDYAERGQIDALHRDGVCLDVDIYGLEDVQANEYFVLKGDNSSCIAKHKEGCLYRVKKREVYGVSPRNVEQTFALDALLDSNIPLVSLSGKAGTGKTILSLAAALEKRGEYRQIFLARPIVPLGNRDIGFLPGDVGAKLEPYMQPLWDNLGVIRHKFPQGSKENKKIADLLEQEKLVVAPLAFIRGRSLDKVFFIIDESQNLTPHEMKTVITRAGEGAKFVVTGDVEQIDTPYLDKYSNGLSYLTSKMKGQSLYAHVELRKGERSALSELASRLL